MLRRRRSLALKIVLGASLIYFVFFILLSRQFIVKDAADTSDIQSRQRRTPDIGRLTGNADFAAAGDVQQPVLERLDLDRFRFQEAMHRDAERAELRKQRLEDERKHHEEDRRRRAADRVIPPFWNAFSSVVYRDTLNSSQITEQKSAMSKMLPLIANGLVVVRWNYEREEPVVAGGPGESGEGVLIDKEKLSTENRTKFDTGWQNNAFNQFASDMISLHRSLPDIRDEGCKSLIYRDILPDATVVVIFHNEAWSVLLRTVHSVLDRSPPHLIKEVILVDDFSDLDHLKTPLDDYVAKLVKVRVMRNKRREGLIRARLLGASVATGKVLVFLDSHCECTMASAYLADSLQLAADVDGWRHLRLADSLLYLRRSVQHSATELFRSLLPVHGTLFTITDDFSVKAEDDTFPIVLYGQLIH